jgi:toxin YoeB
MKIIFAEKAWEDYLYWQQNDKKILRRVNSLIKEITRTPFDGRGKPEPLRENLSGYWSRRIDHSHRLVYKVDESSVYIAQCRFHY